MVRYLSHCTRLAQDQGDPMAIHVAFLPLAPPRYPATFLRKSPLKPLASISRPHCSATMKIDAHVHVWNPTSHPPHPSYPLPDELSRSASYEALLNRMDAAVVEKAILIQPINYRFDHTYALAAAQQHPDRFAVVALADCALPPSQAATALRGLVEQHGVVGVRINPALTPDGRGFDSPTVSALCEECAALSIPAALFARKEDLAGAVELVRAHPRTRFVLDHFAFHAPSEIGDLADSASRFENLSVKASAWFRVSTKEWPHVDAAEALRVLVKAFGSKRVLFGSDFPFVSEKYDYSRAFGVLDNAGLSDEDRDLVAGESALSFYNL